MNTKVTFILGFVCLLAVSQISFAQQSDFTKTNQLLDSLEVHDKFMGTILLAKDGQIQFGRSVGLADQEQGIKNVMETKYRIGSISKMFTSVLIFKTIEDNKLKLDQKLSEFFPSIPNSEKITIAHLLQHRSGIHNFTNDDAYLTYNTKAKSETEMLKIIEAGGSDFEPDTKAAYSNSNFVLLSYILEDIHQQPYSEILQKQIIQPLKLKDTRVFGAVNPQLAEARSYGFNGGWVLEKETHPSIPMGAGAISSTGADLVQFAKGLFEGKLISEKSLNQMMEIKDGYGFGLFSFPYHDKKSFGHTGGIDGFRSMLGYFPEEKLAVVILSNATNWNNNDIILATLDGYYGKEVSIPSFRSYTTKESDLDQYLGDYVSEQIPIAFTFVKDGNTLIAKPTGQPDTKLDATAEHQFEFSPVGAVFIFNPEKGEFTLKQSGASFLYKKK